MSAEKEHIDSLLNTHSNFNTQHAGNDISNEDFLKIQASFFDKESQWYASRKSRPNFTELRLKKIVTSPKKYINTDQSGVLKVLDVGTGTGVLIQYIEDTFSNTCIHALDLSYNQLKAVKLKNPNIDTFHGDISNFINPAQYDIIYCNACFGNLLNQASALKNMSNMLSGNGVVVISHPLGADFVEKLHQSNNVIVPNTLPTSIETLNELINGTNLTIAELIDIKDLYICILKR
jgi:SAM-dependent methyltransferase